MQIRGKEREMNLNKSVYYSDGYFRLEQLCSFAHQINDIHKLSPKNIIEIGIGNGFTSTFLKRAGFDIVTVDINPDLGPDLCVPINELQLYLSGRLFDLVVCCEVLEHMPFDEFEENIRIFSSIGSRLYMTLPNYKRAIGFGGFLRLPKFSPFKINQYIEISWKKKLDKEHFWEVDSSAQTKKKNIIKILNRYYKHTSVSRYALNPYHMSFYSA